MSAAWRRSRLKQEAVRGLKWKGDEPSEPVMLRIMGNRRLSRFSSFSFPRSLQDILRALVGTITVLEEVGYSSGVGPLAKAS